MENLANRNDLWIGQRAPWYASNNPLEVRLGNAMILGPGRCRCGNTCSGNCTVPSIRNIETFESRYLHNASKGYRDPRFIPNSASIHYDVGSRTFENKRRYGTVSQNRPYASFIPYNYYYQTKKPCPTCLRK